MAADLILKAASIITMNDASPRAEAVAVDTGSGVIAAVGALAEVQAAAPGVAVTDLGSVEVGKLADFVQLSVDPYTVDADKLSSEVKVCGTWVNGKKADPAAFLARIESIDPTEHQDLAAAAISHKC